MQVSDWLVVVLLIAIVVVLLDGVRRKLRDRRNRVVVKLERNIPAVDDDVIALAELPNGGARTLPRNDKPAPTLRNLKSTRKALGDPPPRRDFVAAEARPVPVLMDTVDIEEDRIEHTNVFADSTQPDEFLTEEYLDDSDESWETGDEHDDDREEDEEDVDMLAGQPVARRPQGGTETRYHGGNDDDYDDLDEEEFDDEEEDEDDEFEEEDDLLIPGRPELDDDEEEDDDFEDDDYDDDEDDEEDDEEEDELDDEDDLDELGFPDDNFGNEEEVDLLADDYENEPVLLESTYDKATSHFNRPRQQRIEPGFGGASFDESELDEDFSAAQDANEEQHYAAAEPIKPVPLTRRPVSAPPAAAEPAAAAPKEAPRFEQPDQVDLFRESAAETRRSASVPTRPAPARPSAAKPAAARSQPVQEAPQAAGPQEVIIINVMARPGEMLAGYELLPVLQQQGLRLGEMSIFHRHAETNGNGPVIFSMANMVKPGTFDLAGMEDFTTPGISFFLQMPNKLGNMPAFELMLGAATAVRNALDGELKDENRSTFTRQTVEHCRQRIRDFELKLLSKKH